MVASQGLEPQQAESESAVLPLHHEAVRLLFEMAGSTGLEPATPGSTVQCANQLRHNPVSRKRGILYHIYPLQCKWKFHLSALSRQNPRYRTIFNHILRGTFHPSHAPSPSVSRFTAAWSLPFACVAFRGVFGLLLFVFFCLSPQKPVFTLAGAAGPRSPCSHPSPNLSCAKSASFWKPPPRKNLYVLHVWAVFKFGLSPY